MKKIKISIITPSFNQGRYIEEAILSVKEQHYDNFEHIIVDNCSTDETLDIIRKYPHLSVVSEPDEGQSDALNKGFKMATGDVIGWLNADDFYMPGTFEKVNNCFADTSVDGIYSNVHFVNASGEFMRNLISHRPLKWLAYFYTFIQSTSLFFKKEIIDANILLDKELNMCMDRDFYVRLLYGGYKLKYVNDYFASFRWHDSNKSSLNSQRWKQQSLREGLKIINKNLGMNLKPHKWTLFLYDSSIQFVAKPVRGCLKLLPPNS